MASDRFLAKANFVMIFGCGWWWLAVACDDVA